MTLTLLCEQHVLPNPSACLFALVVFLCDGYLKISEDDVSSKEARFLKIMQKLPMELQMVLARRAFGLNGDIIPADIREAAFHYLTKVLSEEEVVA